MAGNKAGNRVPARASILAVPLLLFSNLFASAPDSATSAGSARAFADKIAARYGADAFPQVHSIHYVFHVLHAGKEKNREWTWFPKEDSVLYRGEDDKGLTLTAAYSRRNKYSMASASIAAIDKSFINDEYWLLFPLHLRWDSGLALSLAPGGKLTVRYPKEGGYTPGDMYDLVADKDGTLREWMFHRSGADTVTMQANWAAPTLVSGLPVSLERPGKNGFKVWFTDVKVDGPKYR
jgi:hypothetical protein